MKISDGVVTAVVTALAAAVAYGSMRSTVGTLKDDVTGLQTWRDGAIEKLSGMDAKLDLLLKAQGIEYAPPPKSAGK